MQVVTKQNLANFTEKLLESDKSIKDYVENALFDTSRGQNVLNITSVSSSDSGISVDYTNDMLTISGAKSAGGVIEIQTNTTIEPGTYYLSTDNGNFGVANYYATTVIVDDKNNVVKRSDLVPNTGIEFSVSETTNIKKIKLTYADSRNINFSGHVWINKDSKKEYDKFGEHRYSKIEKNANELSNKIEKSANDLNNKIEKNANDLSKTVSDLSDLENAVLDTFRGQNILNIISVSSSDSGISVNYTDDVLNISGTKSANGIIEIQTDTTINAGTYYLSTDNGSFGVTDYYVSIIIVDNNSNVINRSDLVPSTGIEFSVSETKNIKKIKLTYADNSGSINFNGHVWINKDSKKEYDRFGEYTQSKVEKNTNELSKLDKKVDDINKKVIDIITPKKKTKILLSFDDAQHVYTDGRYDLVRKTFGFPFTFCVSVNAENTLVAPPVEDINKMLFDGIDMGLYSRYGWDSFTDDDFNSNDVAIQNKWNDYVDNAVAKLEGYGYYNPVVWLCRQNKSGTALEKAVKRNHFKMIRGINVNHQYDTTYGYIPSFDKDVSITAEMYGVYTNNLDTALTRLNNAIQNGWDISLFTHKICADASSASDVDSTVEVWTQLLTKIKEYVDAGKAECVTYSEYYRELYPVDCAELDKIRNYKMKYSK